MHATRVHSGDCPTGAIIAWTEIDDFAHLDFTWSVRAAEVIYHPLIRLLSTKKLPLVPDGVAVRSNALWMRAR